MALDTETGGVVADSYVTVAQADSYLENYAGYDITEWDALDTFQKEFRLRTGALLLNTLPWRGAKASREQRLEFPRWWRTDNCYPVHEDEFILYSDIPVPCNPPTVPQDIAYAQIEVMYFAVHFGIMKAAESGHSFPQQQIEQLVLGGCLTVEFFGPNEQSASMNAMWGPGRIYSLDTAWLLCHYWLRKVSGGVI